MKGGQRVGGLSPITWTDDTGAHPHGLVEELEPRAVAALTLALDIWGTTTPHQLTIHLTERLEQREGWHRVPGGCVSPDGQRADLFVASEGRAAIGIERAVLEMVVGGSTGSGIIRALAGLAGGPTDSAATAELFEPDRDRPRLASTEEVSFLRFLEGTYGRPALGRFLRAAVAGDDPAAAAESAFRLPLIELVADWRRRDTPRRQAGSTARDLLRRALPALRPYWLRELELVLYMALDLAFSLAIPLSTKYLFDEVIVPRDYDLLAVWLVVVPLIFAVGTLASYRREVVGGLIGESVRRDLRREAFTHVQHLSMRFYSGRSTGDILARLTSDVDAVRAAVGDVLPALSFQLVSLVVSAVVVLSLDWILGGIMLLGLPVAATLYTRSSARLRAASRELSDRVGETTSTIQENLSGQMVVKSLALEPVAIAAFEVTLARQLASARTMQRIGAFLSAGTQAMFQGVRVLLLGVGAVLIMDGRITLGDLVAALGLMGQLLSPVMSLSGQYRQLQAATGAFDRLREVLDEEPDVVEDPAAVDLGPLREAIRVEHVIFRYGETAALDDAMITIPAGARAAIVGPSGSGKSTLLGLFLRLHDPSEGRVTYDGTDLREATLSSLRRQLSLVPQDTFLFNASISENIALGRLDASRDDVVDASTAAALHDFIVSGTEDGYDTVVGERGGRLSGGQRQRLGIARALIRQPSVLVLDEATSALDADSEAAVLQTLRQVSAELTVIMITHRIASVVDFDLIYVLERGRVVESGTHEQLYDRRGLYWRLYSEQQQGLADALPLPIEARRLARVPIFAALPPLELARTSLRVSVERFGPGEVVVRQGEPADKLYVVAAGQVEVLVGRDGAEPRQVAVLGPEGYFGELELMNEDGRRRATVRAVTDTELYALGRDDFRDLLRSQPGLGEVVERLARMRVLQSG